MDLKGVNSSGNTVCGHTYDEYIEMIKSFHGHIAPGVVLGGYMVDLAYKNLPQGEIFDAICETRSCLPDAIQLLTPCTVGNGWLRIVDLGRFAMSLFEKYSGNAVRVYLDDKKLANWPELRTFFFKLKPKKEQDLKQLMCEIKTASTAIFSVEKVVVDLNSIRSPHTDVFRICPSCGESYPENDRGTCLGCQGKGPYLGSARQSPNRSL